MSDRGASIRIPWQVEKDGKGYAEDRRPNANCDPYVVARLLTETVCGAPGRAAGVNGEAAGQEGRRQEVSVGDPTQLIRRRGPARGPARLFVRFANTADSRAD